MNLTVMLLIVLLLASVILLARAHSQARPIAAPAKERGPARRARALREAALPGRAPHSASAGPGAPAPEPAAQPAAFEWHGALGSPSTPAEPVATEDVRARIRDRYIGARFPGVFRTAGELKDAARVVRAARLYFEEDDCDRAQELLEIASLHWLSEKAPRLAQLEIAYLMRDAELYTRLARAFVAVHPASAEWSDVVRLGHAVAPHEELFTTHGNAQRHPNYGPWPDMPNWIQASWDLTSEVLAGDFHRAMTAQAADAHQSPRKVA